MNANAKIKMCNDVITHWTENLLLAHAGLLEKEDIRSDGCAFCDKWFEFYCDDCPICLCSSSAGDCADTPWYDLNITLYDMESGNIGRHNATLVKKVELELTFLEKVCDAWINNAID
jgi:hypothetical protein